jgi:hypothetical protein
MQTHPSLLDGFSTLEAFLGPKAQSIQYVSCSQILCSDDDLISHADAIDSK